MAYKGDSPDIVGSGEYGATTVSVAVDGSMTRIAFGRNAASGKRFYGAVVLSPEALAELKGQMEALGLWSGT